METNVRVIEATASFYEESARVPYKFGNALLREITRAEVRVRVADRSGRTAVGVGTMFLSHLWAWPGGVPTLAEKDAAMRTATSAFCRTLFGSSTVAHPVDLFLDAATSFDSIAGSMPRLAMLNCASPADAALHDAFGRLHGLNVYETYGPKFMRRDLASYLGDDCLRGRFIADALEPPSSRVAIFHTVGGLDALTESDVHDDAPRDGLPNSLEQWIARDGLRSFKVKLGGRDLPADVDRMLAIWDVVGRRASSPVELSIDPNEQCESPAYLVELLERVRSRAPAAYDAVVLIEQPTARDLMKDRHDLRPLARLKPTLIDESLTGPADLDVARELGWSGVVLKACKCQTLTLLTAAKAAALGMPMCVADLTNPDVALLQSVGLAARLPVMAGVEANCRQFFPAALDRVARDHEPAVRVRDGMASTETLRGPGLGFGAAG